MRLHVICPQRVRENLPSLSPSTNSAPVVAGAIVRVPPPERSRRRRVALGGRNQNALRSDSVTASRVPDSELLFSS